MNTVIIRNENGIMVAKISADAFSHIISHYRGHWKSINYVTDGPMDVWILDENASWTSAYGDFVFYLWAGYRFIQ